MQVERHHISYHITQDGIERKAVVVAPHVARLMDHMPVKAPPDLSRFLLAPMPGLLVSVSAQAGQRVEAGEPLAVIEAMKMENVLKAGSAGTVARLLAEPGATLEVDQPIMEFE